MAKIKSIKAREILDSRGNPTVEVSLETNLGKFQASCPSGASKGEHEAKELRDGGKRYFGKGVKKAVRNVNKILAPKLIGKDPTRQKKIDEMMIGLDGTENKARLGANAILPVSMAVCRAGASTKNLSLYQYIAGIYQNGSPPLLRMPRASFNVINGGVHAGNELDFQEFMIVPQVKTFRKTLQIASEIYHQLKELLKTKYGSQAVNVGDEGGFAPPFRRPEQALNFILKATEKLGYQNRANPVRGYNDKKKIQSPQTSNGVKIILDVAASQFFTKKGYKMRFGVFTKEGLSRYYLSLVKKYPIIAIEDPFAQDDWQGWKKISNLKSQISNLLIIGDDLLVTNPKRIKLAEERKACNAVILKPNQIGTITEAIEASKLAKSYGWKTIVSHRSGDTCDDFIADFAVGISADFIKSGAPARGERVAKYNRLLRIEEEILNSKLQ